MSDASNSDSILLMRAIGIIGPEKNDLARVTQTLRRNIHLLRQADKEFHADTERARRENSAIAEAQHSIAEAQTRWQEAIYAIAEVVNTHAR